MEGGVPRPCRCAPEAPISRDRSPQRPSRIRQAARDLRDAAGAALIAGGLFGLPVGLAAAAGMAPSLDLELAVAPTADRAAVFVLPTDWTPGESLDADETAADAATEREAIEPASPAEDAAAEEVAAEEVAAEDAVADAGTDTPAGAEDGTTGGRPDLGLRPAPREAVQRSAEGDDTSIIEFGPRGPRKGTPVVLVRHSQRMLAHQATGEAPAVKERKRGRKCDDASGAIEDQGGGRFRVERELVDMYVNDLKLAAELASVAWHDGEDGKRDGFRIRRIRCGTVLHEAGFRNGDVVHSVNGKKIRTVLGAIGAYRKLKRKDHLRVDVTRKNGEQLKLRYDIG